MKNNEELSPWKENKLIFNNLGKFIVISMSFYLLFKFVFSFQGWILILFPITISYLIIKFIDKRTNKNLNYHNETKNHSKRRG